MTILKSINIVDDLAHPARASHYRPTTKSMDILRSVIGLHGSAATSVIASYGSGKSIAAMIGGLLVEGETGKIAALGDAGARLQDFDPDLRERFQTRSKAGAHGFVVALNGHVPDLPAAIAQAFGFDFHASLTATLRRAEAALKRKKHDGLAIIWDEFGRHLEALVSKGRAEDLALVQDLAEWTIRRTAPPATLTLLLHQDFHQYSLRLGQGEQAAWKKIEGRFDTLRIIEDSDEVYPFIADLVRESVSIGQCRITADHAEKAHDLGLFPFLKDTPSLLDLLRRAAPLSPSALYLLPKIAGRVGQSERTIFGFLDSELHNDRGALVGIEDVYRYFSEAMRTDTGVGGSHRRFVETESARSRASNDIQREVLAAAALLHLAANGRDSKVSREKLRAFLDLGSTHGCETLDAAMNELLDRKLLLHRHLTDEVSVWHGSDVDIRALVAETMDSLRGGSEGLEQIRALVPSPTYLAPEYNHLTRMTRHASGVFTDMETLGNPKGREELLARADDADAIVALVVDGSREDHESIQGDWLCNHPHLILAFADQRPDLAMVSLEAAALDHLARDAQLLEMDPLVSREIEELRANALEYLAARASLLTDPEAGAVSWFSAGECLGRGDDLHAAEAMSRIFSDRFPFTPRISNEQIVRRKVTPQTRSARKRLLLGILERSEVPDMGHGGASSSAASIYRTTLVATGLYDGDLMTWRQPEELHDEGLARVWNTLRSFFAAPEEGAKRFSGLLAELTSPPCGIRPGLLPILVTAGLRAFGKAVAIRKFAGGTWQYVEDIQPSLMEEICETPDLFEIEVISTTKAIRKRIARLVSEFSVSPDPVETDLVRAFYDALTAWRRNLPSAAMRSRSLGDEATQFQSAIRQTNSDPVSLLFRAFPAIAGEKTLNDAVVNHVATARRQIERVKAKYAEDAIEASQTAFSTGAGGRCESLLGTARSWAEQMPHSLAASSALDSVSKGILRQARSAHPERHSEQSFVRALSHILVKRDFEEWDDATVREFARQLRMQLRSIEDAVLSVDKDDPEIVPFLERKIETYFRKLSRAGGQKDARALIAKLGEDIE